MDSTNDGPAPNPEHVPPLNGSDLSLLSTRQHAVLDYVTVVLFALAPTLFGLDGVAAAASYVLAGVHLTMTLLTRFAGGVIDAIPFDLHATVELAVGVVLLVAPWVLGSTLDTNEQLFFAVVGAVILAVWALTGARLITSDPIEA